MADLTYLAIAIYDEIKDKLIQNSNFRSSRIIHAIRFWEEEIYIDIMKSALKTLSLCQKLAIYNTNSICVKKQSEIWTYDWTKDKRKTVI